MWGSYTEKNPSVQDAMPIPTIQSLPLFHGLKQQTLDLIVPRFTFETFTEDEVVFEQAAPAKKLYILVNGKVEIRFKPDDGEQITVTEIDEGGVFGWSAALGRENYTSCAISVAESKAFSVLGEELKQLCEQYPDTGVIILERLAAVIAQRLQKTHAQVVELLHAGVSS
jgi:CRP/FNR family cyclic AMP-dependent transcriptional regulator